MGMMTFCDYLSSIEESYHFACSYEAKYIYEVSPSSTQSLKDQGSDLDQDFFYAICEDFEGVLPRCEDEASINGDNAKANNGEVNVTDDVVNAMIQTLMHLSDVLMPPLMKLKYLIMNLMILESLIMQWTIRTDYLFIN